MQQLEHIMQKEMTRKEFLMTLGFGIASVLGFSSVLRLLFGRGEQAQSQTTKATNHGYGALPYGGKKA